MGWTSLLALALLAQPANPYLDEARVLVREVKFSEALAQLKVARQVPGLTRAQSVEVIELTARCHVAQGNRPEAEAAYTELLTLAPSFQPDRQLSPKILETFDAAKQRLYPRDYLKLVREPAPPGRVRVRLIDPWAHIAGVTVTSQQGEQEPVGLPTTAADDVIEFEVNPAAAEVVQWRLQANDSAQSLLATLEDTVAPAPGLTAVPTSPPEGLEEQPDRVTRVVPWVAAAVAVAAAGVATALQLNSQALARSARDSTQAPGDWADTARSANEQAQARAAWSIGLYVTAGAAAVGAVVGFAW